MKITHFLILASSIHSQQSLYSNSGQQPQQHLRSSLGCESIPDMNDGFHMHHESNQTNNSSRFDFEYANNSTEEDELLDVIAKWQEN